MRFLLLWCFVVQSVFPSFVYAKPVAVQQDYSPQLMAQYAADFLTHAKTVGGVMKMLSVHLTPEQLKSVEAYYKKMGVSQDSKFPKLKHDGNRIYFDSNNYIQVQDGNTIIINGYVFQQSKESFDEALKKMYSTLSAPKNAGSLFIPSAHAMAPLMIGLLAVGGMALAGYFLGPMLFNSTPTEGAIGGGLLGGVAAAAFLLKDNKQHIHCDQRQYVYRPPGAIGRPVPGQVLNQVYGPQVPPCNSPVPFRTAMADWPRPGSAQRPINLQQPGRLPGTPVQITPIGQ